MSGLKLVGEVSLDGSGFERGLHQIGHTASHNLKSLVVSAFGVYSVHQAIHRTIESAEELVTASKRLDVTVEQLQVLRQAAKDNSVEFGKLATAFEKLDVAREKALGGGKDGAKMMAAFKRLGISESDLKDKTAADIFTGPLRDTVMKRNSEEIAGDMKEVFNKGFGELIPLLKTDFDELEHKMKSLGSLMSTETAVQVKYLADEFGLLSNIIVAQVGPALVQFTYWILEQVQKIRGAMTFWERLRSGVQERTGTKPSFLEAVDAMNYHRAMPQEQEDAIMNQNNQESKTYAMWSEAIVEAADAGLKVTTEGLRGLNEIKSKMKAEADSLKHPKPPVFQRDETEAVKTKMGHVPTSPDALVRVGNFLGSSRDIIAHLAERQVQLLQQIANNTRSRNFEGDGSSSFLNVV